MSKGARRYTFFVEVQDQLLAGERDLTIGKI